MVTNDRGSLTIDPERDAGLSGAIEVGGLTDVVSRVFPHNVRESESG